MLYIFKNISSPEQASSKLIELAQDKKVKVIEIDNVQPEAAFFIIEALSNRKKINKIILKNITIESAIAVLDALKYSKRIDTVVVSEMEREVVKKFLGELRDVDFLKDIHLQSNDAVVIAHAKEIFCLHDVLTINNVYFDVQQRTLAFNQAVADKLNRFLQDHPERTLPTNHPPILSRNNRSPSPPFMQNHSTLEGKENRASTSLRARFPVPGQ